MIKHYQPSQGRARYTQNGWQAVYPKRHTVTWRIEYTGIIMLLVYIIIVLAGKFI